MTDLWAVWVTDSLLAGLGPYWCIDQLAEQNLAGGLLNWHAQLLVSDVHKCGP